MDKRTLTTGAVVCVLGIVVVGVWRGDLHEPSIAAAAEPSSTPARSLPARPTTAVGNDKIQIALLVDTSSDMDPFIDEARTQLWQVVREYAGATRHGRRARLEVAFYEYGNGALLGRSGQVRQ